MSIKSGYLRAVSCTAAAIFIVIIIAASIFLQKIYESSLTSDIFLYSRKLEQSVWKAETEQWARLQFLSEAARTVTSGSSGSDLRSRLEGLTGLYGPDSLNPGIISSAGYFDSAHPGLQNLFNFKTGKWQETEYQFRIKRSDERVQIVSGSDPEPDNSFFLVKTVESPVILFFLIDTEGFRDTYLKPAAEAALEDYQFEWIELGSSEDRRDLDIRLGLNADEYRFQPFRILANRNKSTTRLLIPVPVRVDGRMFSNYEEKKEDDRGAMMPFINTPDLLIGIRHESGPFYYELERKAAAGYLESMLVLLVIGVSFLLLLFQFGKLRQLRLKEREFVASVTHELRTPLTVIQAAADNLSTGIVPPEKLKIYGNLIVEQSGRLGKMIEEILLFSRMEDKKQKPPAPVQIDFSAVTADLKSTLGAISKASGVTLHWDTSGLPPVCLGDLETILLVTENLVSNAVFHAYNAGGEVRIQMKYSIPGTLLITVEDDGRGIESRELRHIFDPFFRDSQSRQNQEKGSGLGLFIAKRKVEVAGGRLTVESPYLRIDGHKAGGCRFIMTLPCLADDGVQND